MSMLGAMENLHASQETRPMEQAAPVEQPPALERRDTAEQAGDMPPAFGRREGTEQAGDAPPRVERRESGEIALGESVELRGAQYRLETAIKNGNKIAADHAMADIAKIKAKEAAK